MEYAVYLALFRYLKIYKIVSIQIIFIAYSYENIQNSFNSNQIAMKMIWSGGGGCLPLVGGDVCLWSGGVCIPACNGADTPPLLHGQNSRHTLLKILPCSNFFAGGNNRSRFY